MEQLLSTLTFILPGLLCYYWVLIFGVTPPQKHNTFEMLSISALLWVPVTFVNLGIYNLAVILDKGAHKLQYIYDIKQLNSISGSLVFQSFYIIASLIFSCVIAYIMSGKGYDLFLASVNIIRSRRNLTELSKRQTVWEEVFLPDKRRVLEITSINNPDYKIIGGLKNSPRPLEPERHIVLEHIDILTNVVQKNRIRVEKILVDTKSGMVIKLFDQAEIEYALKNKAVD